MQIDFRSVLCIAIPICGGKLSNQISLEAIWSGVMKSLVLSPKLKRIASAARFVLLVGGRTLEGELLPNRVISLPHRFITNQRPKLIRKTPKPN
jgi:hypothetical protein